MPSAKHITCLIVDDEPPAKAVLTEYITRVDALQLAGCCNSAMEAITFLSRQPVDLMFLDIHMPGLLGTTFVRTLRNPPKIIFTTAYRKFALEGFELNAVDFLLKPIGFERFLTGVNRVLQTNLQLSADAVRMPERQVEKTCPFLYIRADKKMVKVVFEKIVFVESLKDYIRITTTGGTVVTRQAISSLEEMLPEEDFLRIHRSFIVSLNKIDAYYGDLVQIAGQELPVGRLFKHRVSEKLDGWKTTG